MWHLGVLLANDPPASTGDGSFGGILWLLPLIMLLFWFLVLRPMRRQEQERQALANSVKKNDKVLTSGGIYGTVVNLSETEDEVTVRVDDNVRLRMVKSSIIRNLTNEEAAKAAKEAKK
jgi:preprotein translocase subunit YajC